MLMPGWTRKARRLAEALGFRAIVVTDFGHEARARLQDYTAFADEASPRNSSVGALLAHFGKIEDPREPWRVAHPLPEVLLPDDYEGIADWGEAHLDFLRRLPALQSGRAGRALAHPADEPHRPQLFSAAFTARVRESWLERVDLVAMDGKTSRRSHDRKADRGPLHLVSAFATTSRLVLG